MLATLLSIQLGIHNEAYAFVKQQLKLQIV